MHPLSEQDVSSFRADLHTHTLYSDGSCTPKELIDLAVEAGLQALSITDHDTVEAYKEAIPYAKDKGLLLGTGVEFSSIYKTQNVHILGYNFDIDNPLLQAFCQQQQERRKNRNLIILDKLARFRFIITADELEAVTVLQKAVGRPHIAQILVEKGYVKSIQEAFSIYLGDGKCCYEQGDNGSLEEVIHVITQAKGKVFLAHPHLIYDGLFVKQILSHPFDGIECYYGRCSKEKERRWLKMARDRALLISGGSDFHGSMKPYISLGCSWVPHKEFLEIFPQYA
ncbi:MAG: PHP domain-containing protein [Chlamydiae bacterium]|nr:PHP domain-containing protein [Chlamydiota bacterium]